MAELTISEAGSVQFPMIRHATEVGWQPISPDNALRKRGGEAGMLFRDELEAALGRFNPWMSGDAIRQVVETLAALPPTIEGNRALLSWMRGERRRRDEAEKRDRAVRLVDFESPSENALHVTWEWKLKPPGRKGNRADAMFLVNGVPACIVEHKNPSDGAAIDRATAQLRRYEKETPELVGSPQLFNATHLLDYWYGVTWNVNRRYIARWKRDPDETYRFAVQSFFEPADFLRTLRQWILFYVEDGETRKSVLREHQRAAINRVVERCADPSKQRGLIWHTQGSGKTFTLLTAAGMILRRRERFGSPLVIVVADRAEIEGQLRDWVERLLGETRQEDIPVFRANSKADLQKLLRTDRSGLIVSMIHKFEGIEKNVNRRDDIYVFIDEAHRSVARELGTYLMAALPNATIIGFTGTPIARTEHGQGTFAIFGADDEQGYLAKYSIKESIADGMTLPIRHDLAPGDLTIPTERLDREFFALAGTEGVTDVEELNRALDKAATLRTFLTADARVEKVASFVAKHFREKVEPLGYKALLVAVSRVACAKYKEALDRMLPSSAWSEAVYTGHPDDIVERPVVARNQLSADREADVRLSFKKSDENPKILIVTDKLLTGYDAPILYCMYLDKPMRDHVLLQAIARVNRPHAAADGTTKRVGLVVDFIGVLRNLEKALRFDSDDYSGVIEDLDRLLSDLLERIDRARSEYLTANEDEEPHEHLERIILQQFLDPVARKQFYEDFKNIEDPWEIISPSAALRDHVPTYKELAGLFRAVRNAHEGRDGYVQGLARKTQALIEEAAEQSGPFGVAKSVTFGVETLAKLQNKPVSDEAKVFSLTRGLQKAIEDESDLAPILRALSERARRIIEDLENRRITTQAAMDLLSATAKEKEDARRAWQKSGLSPPAFGVQWLLKDDEALAAAGVPSAELARTVEALYARFSDAAVNEEERRRLQSALYEPLVKLAGGDGGALAQDERKRIVDEILCILLPDAPDAEAH